jgi:hypothetical protein
VDHAGALATTFYFDDIEWQLATGSGPLREIARYVPEFMVV